MDHLPRPRASPDLSKPFEIPYMHNPEFDYQKSTFFEQLNVEKARGSEASIAAILQSRLFFGVIREIFERISGITFDWTDFVRDSEKGYKVISTKVLPTLIGMWHAREADAPRTESLERLSKVQTVLQGADGVILRAAYAAEDVEADTNLEDCSSDSYPTIAAALLSSKILGMTLFEALKTVYGDFTPIEGAKSHHSFNLDLHAVQNLVLDKSPFQSSFERDPIISCLLERAGWCPYQVETCDRLFVSQGNLGLRYYMTFLDRREIPGNHKECTPVECFGSQVDEENYKTQHFMSMECDCAFVSLSHGYETNLILDTVRQGGTPLLRRENDSVRIFRLGLDGPPPPYVAISHVWAEGLGNPKENALPWCVIKVLQYAAEGSCVGVENLHFWIDTLCIPVNHNEERVQAIKKIAQLYAGAEKVVVLDRSLMKAYCKTYREEVLIRISASPWAARLWTLQEGRLSKALSFFFADKFYETGHVAEETSKHFQGVLFWDAEIPIWKDWYEKHRDPLALRLIESTAELGMDEAIACLKSIVESEKSLAVKQSSASSLRTVDVLKNSAGKNQPPGERQSKATESTTEGLPETQPSTFISRMAEFFRRKAIRVQANNAFINIGSCPHGHELSSSLTPAQQYDSIVSNMTRRSLTRPEDETVCLATLFGMDLDPILQKPSADERMKSFLTSLGSLPLSILLTQTPKLQEYGQRWIPKTLLRGRIPQTEAECVVQADGRLRYVGCGLVSQLPVAISTAGDLYFTIDLSDGEKFFVGIPPQPGLEISRDEKTYVIIPSRPPLARGHLPQRVVVLSAVEDRNTSLVDDDGACETRYEYVGWIFPKYTSDEMRLVGGNYDIWQDSAKYAWHCQPEECVDVTFSLTRDSQNWVIG